MNTLKKRGLRALLFVGIYAGLLLLLEGAGQLIVAYLEYNKPSGIFGEEILSHNEPLLGFGLKKNVDRTFGHWRAQTNSLGFRHGEFPVEKPSDEYRIFVLGGSTVFGWGSDGPTTIPSFLEKQILEEQQKLGLTHKRVRVINAGVPWYASWHETAMFLFRVLPLNPDHIIILDGLNDTAAGINPDWAPVHLGYLDAPTQVAYRKRHIDTEKRNFVTSLLQLSPTYRYFHARWRMKKETEEVIANSAIWDQYISYMQSIHEMTQRRGIQFSLFFQPVIAVDRTLDIREIASNASALKKPAIAKTFRELYLEGEQKLLAQKNLPFKSLKSLFKTAKYTAYQDGLHYTGQGNFFIAERIFEETFQGKLSSILKGATHLKS